MDVLAEKHVDCHSEQPGNLSSPVMEKRGFSETKFRVCEALSFRTISD
jgi:hypothetical protein